jgi:hypothetical protein
MTGRTDGQFHGGKVEIVRGRDDIGRGTVRSKSSMWKDVYTFKHSQK